MKYVYEVRYNLPYEGHICYGIYADQDEAIRVAKSKISDNMYRDWIEVVKHEIGVDNAFEEPVVWEFPEPKRPVMQPLHDDPDATEPA